MKKVIHLLVLSCKKASGLIEKRSVVKLSIGERIQLGLHKSLCDACTAYEKQSKKMDEILHQHLHGNAAERITPVQNEGLKEKVLKSLR